MQYVPDSFSIKSKRNVIFLGGRRIQEIVYSFSMPRYEKTYCCCKQMNTHIKRNFGESVQMVLSKANIGITSLEKSNLCCKVGFVSNMMVCVDFRLRYLHTITIICTSNNKLVSITNN